MTLIATSSDGRIARFYLLTQSQVNALITWFSGRDDSVYLTVS